VRAGDSGSFGRRRRDEEKKNTTTTKPDGPSGLMTVVAHVFITLRPHDDDDDGGGDGRTDARAFARPPVSPILYVFYTRTSLPRAFGVCAACLAAAT